MANPSTILVLISILIGTLGCNNTKNNKAAAKEEVVQYAVKTNIEIKTKPGDFVPAGYIVFEEIFGDLNKDGLEDCVIIIKGTDKNRVIKDEYRGELDQNRRGIIILFKKNAGYELAIKNDSCFSSENEDGGGYYAPDLSFDIVKNNLYIHYSHGRYGYWKYTFSFMHPDFELIGYDKSEDSGPVINREISINYLTKKKVVKQNTNKNAEEEGDELFEQTITNITITKRIRLSEIKDFDNLNILEH